MTGPRPVSAATRQEVLNIVESVKSNAKGIALGDRDVLQILAWVMGNMGQGALYSLDEFRDLDRAYRVRLGVGDETLALFAKATEKHPNNEGVAMEVFLHYVKVNELRSAQQVSRLDCSTGRRRLISAIKIAMRIHRTVKNEQWLWWSVMSILLQMRDPDNPSNDILLSLAERQITDHYSQRLTEHKKKAVASNGVASIEAPTDKGKGKGAAEGAEVATAVEPAAEEGPEYDSAHEFFIVSRFLELRARRAMAKETTSTSDAVSPSTSPSQLALPSITSSGSLSPRQTLLAHFASKEGDRWCEGLGLEIWRREIELRLGSAEGDEWVKSWERTKKSLEGG